MNEKMKAKKYLEDRQLTVLYYLVDRDNTHIKEDTLMYTEEYPDFIPRKDEIVLFDNKKHYFVQNIAYDTKNNKVYIMVMTKKEYTDIHLKRHI